jgi:Fic family protein
MLSIDGRLSDSLIRKKKELDALHLPQSAFAALSACLETEMIYNSNALDGNSLSLQETAFVLNSGMAIKGKPLKEHLEVRDQRSALMYIKECVRDRRGAVSGRALCALHQILMRDTEGERAGKYRNKNVAPYGKWHKPPAAADVPSEMENLFAWYRDEQKYLSRIERVALFHHKLMNIHPFVSGNGKAARLFMALQLMRDEYPLVVILKHDRKKYFDALKAGDGGEYGPLVGLIMQAVNRSLDMCLRTLRPASGKKEHFVLLADLSTQFPYSAKYLNLLVRQGKLEAHKDGRNWFSSKDAVNRYIAGRQRKR